MVINREPIVVGWESIERSRSMAAECREDVSSRRPAASLERIDDRGGAAIVDSLQGMEEGAGGRMRVR